MTFHDEHGSVEGIAKEKLCRKPRKPRKMLCKKTSIRWESMGGGERTR